MVGMDNKTLRTCHTSLNPSVTHRVAARRRLDATAKPTRAWSGNHFKALKRILGITCLYGKGIPICILESGVGFVNSSYCQSRIAESAKRKRVLLKMLQEKGRVWQITLYHLSRARRKKKNGSCLLTSTTCKHCALVATIASLQRNKLDN